MAEYVLHFGHNVYLSKDGGMTRKITEAAVYYDRKTAGNRAKEIVHPPHCSPQTPTPNPPEIQSLHPEQETLELDLDIPPRICRLH